MDVINIAEENYDDNSKAGHGHEACKQKCLKCNLIVPII